MDSLSTLASSASAVSISSPLSNSPSISIASLPPLNQTQSTSEQQTTTTTSTAATTTTTTNITTAPATTAATAAVATNNTSNLTMIRIYCKERPPVGIPVIEHLELNISPLAINLTNRFFRTMIKFFFESNNNSSTQPTTTMQKYTSSMNTSMSSSSVASTSFQRSTTLPKNASMASTTTTATSTTTFNLSSVNNNDEQLNLALLNLNLGESLLIIIFGCNYEYFCNFLCFKVTRLAAQMR